MSTPDAGHGHGHQNGQGPAEQTPFIPDAHFAMQAQSEELNRLRGVETRLSDQLIYMRATVLQMQAEANHQIGLHLGTIEQLNAELAALRKKITPTQHGGDERGGIEVDPDPADIRVGDEPISSVETLR